ncbi:SDR family oxidoreductase [Dinghuibacter silviterrae]|uniref:Nucleoside-diphosphate-sugar epimerase n=1 Tax=Dinghuibacter silviterrae TaxID=1539049 RepID=A0A4R8DT39_9BACT|nr:aldehyde reductase [Dinghuibacter silviterrae]TDX01444.1 nucleoside-diphosphate-sugar epimerase [Dinghuibacter silviterrae]
MDKKETVLVTGGTGFVGVHCILQLLQKGYRVKTTLRTMNRKEEVLDMLRNGGIATPDGLEFVEADLMKDANWDKAVKDCRFVLHVASPMATVIPRDENEVIRPAVDGTLRVLTAAKNAGVKRVVLTSNFGAVGYSHKDPHTVITEEEWSNPHQKGMTAYNRSKILAERAAWDFIRKEGEQMELAVINPVAIFGPTLGRDISGSFAFLTHMLDGSMKSIPQLNMNIADVRDVADLHIRAMTHPGASGQRFLALSGGAMSLPEMAVFLKKEMPGVSQKVSTKVLSNGLVRLAGLFNKQAKAIAPLLGVSRNVSNAKAKKMLDWQPIATNEQAIVASVESMIKFGVLQ